MSARHHRLARRAARFAVEHATWILFAVVIAVFGALAPSFVSLENARTILVQSASVGITAVGMTFVLLTAGIDLSVGALMLLAGAAVATISPVEAAAPAGLDLLGVVAVALGIGALWGAGLGLFVSLFGVAPFLVTLAGLFLGRGLGMQISETRVLPAPECLSVLGTGDVAGLPGPLVIFGVVLLLGHVALRRTPFGRAVQAVGDDPVAARKVGVPMTRVLVGVYAISGACAALAGLVALSQLGTVSPSLGEEREFEAIAAAVLGGTSLFGGRGSVVPGALLGTVLIQTIQSGLTTLDVDLYLQPVITAALLFFAVLVDTARTRWIERRDRRAIRIDEDDLDRGGTR